MRKRPPPIGSGSPAPEGEFELILQYKAGGPGASAAGAALLKMHGGVIYTEVRCFLRMSTDPEDVLQEAHLGFLEDGVKRFDPDRGVKLITYACKWAKARAAVCAKEQRSSIRVPAASQDPTKSAATQLRAERALHPQRLDAPAIDLETGCPLSRKDMLVSPTMPTDEALHEARETGALSRIVPQLLDRLPARERAVLTRRVMVDPEDAETLAVIGADFGVCRERMRQVEAKTLLRCRTLLVGMGVSGWQDVASARVGGGAP